MAGILAALASLAAPMFARILIAAGLSIVTVTGVAVAFGQLRDSMISNVGALPTGIAQLIGLAGGWVALGAIVGAMSFVVALWGLTAATRIAGVS